MSTATAERRLAAILAADVIGYSRAVEADEETAIREFRAHREAIFALVADHHGRVFTTGGDSVLAEFSSPVESVRCAVAIQQAVENGNAGLAEASRMRFRIGVNLGDVVVDGDNLLGDGVNVAARLESLAGPAEVFISRSVLDQVRKQLPFRYDSRGKLQLKNIAEPMEVYRVSAENFAPGRRSYPWGLLGHRWRWAVAAAPVLLLLAVTGGWWMALSDAVIHPEFSLGDKPSIAVMPFATFSNEEEQRFLAEGIAEDIITELARNSELTVMARSAAFDLSEKGLSAKDVANELGVKYVLAGSVRRAGEELRISAQLIDVGSGNHVWADRFDSSASAIYQMQDDIVTRIVGTLLSEVRETRKAAVLRRPPRNLDVYELSLRGLARKHRLNREDSRLARDELLRATELDPQYAPAWLYLGWVEAIAIMFEWIDGLDLNESIGKIEKAIELDPTLATAYQGLGMARAVAGDAQGSLRAAKRSVELGPGDADNLLFLGRALATNGAFDEAVAHARRAVALNPSRPSYYAFHLGRPLWGQGALDESNLLMHECLTKAPGFTACRVFQIANHVGLGNFTQASKAATALLDQSPGFSIEDALKSVGFAGDPVSDERLRQQLAEAGLPAGDKMAEEQ